MKGEDSIELTDSQIMMLVVLIEMLLDDKENRGEWKTDYKKAYDVIRRVVYDGYYKREDKHHLNYVRNRFYSKLKYRLLA